MIKYECPACGNSKCTIHTSRYGEVSPDSNEPSRMVGASSGPDIHRPLGNKTGGTPECTNSLDEGGTSCSAPHGDKNRRATIHSPHSSDSRALGEVQPIPYKGEVGAQPVTPADIHNNLPLNREVYSQNILARIEELQNAIIWYERNAWLVYENITKGKEYHIEKKSILDFLEDSFVKIDAYKKSRMLVDERLEGMSEMLDAVEQEHTDELIDLDGDDCIVLKKKKIATWRENL